ncbi:hypothetical protein PIB30_077985 [Stylosanthes scabra]|uniref:Uncharacterized protein n=1 Tax=Stylosanthes scabra TaxID=79078 RepID=A0ABU6YPJ4_9FABA|nr:hypothetical protein [Stylosanthes scabra]
MHHGLHSDDGCDGGTWILKWSDGTAHDLMSVGIQGHRGQIHSIGINSSLSESIPMSKTWESIRKKPESIHQGPDFKFNVQNPFRVDSSSLETILRECGYVPFVSDAMMVVMSRLLPKLMIYVSRSDKGGLRADDPAYGNSELSDVVSDKGGL